MRTNDLVGQRFGRLTVLERTDEKKAGYYVWRCRCDCGGEILADTRRLKRGTISDCGCVEKKTARSGAKAEDLTGRRFGHLEVLYRVEGISPPKWMCRCDCGREKAISAHDLKAGTKSCGCRTFRRKTEKVDLTGRKFGRLKVQYPTGRRDAKGSVYWHCLCDCGGEKDVTEDNLVHGGYRSCGCLQKELQASINSQLHMLDGTCLEILENRKYRSDNTSGFRGVYHMRNGNYKATIGFKRQRFHIGTYPEFSLAVEARLEAEELIFQGFLDDYQKWKKRGISDPEWARKNPFIFDVAKRDGGFEITRGTYTV